MGPHLLLLYASSIYWFPYSKDVAAGRNAKRQRRGRVVSEIARRGRQNNFTRPAELVCAALEIAVVSGWTRCGLLAALPDEDLVPGCTAEGHLAIWHLHGVVHGFVRETSGRTLAVRVNAFGAAARGVRNMGTSVMALSLEGVRMAPPADRG